MRMNEFLAQVERFREQMGNYVHEMECYGGLDLSSPDDVLKY